MTIKSKPLTKEYVEGYERVYGPVALDEQEPAEPRKVRPHACERCGHEMQYDDQTCGCTSRNFW